MLCSGLSTTLLLAATCLLLAAGVSRAGKPDSYVPASAEREIACDDANNVSCVRIVACEHTWAKLQCGRGRYIFVIRANYGRHDRTTCAYKRPPCQVQNVYCSRPTYIVAKRCNGKNHCAVKASNSVFGDPCWGTYKYLEVVYTCKC
ncbi:L-rhamnose-binding lectin SML-like [Symphorus nematophorus]